VRICQKKIWPLASRLSRSLKVTGTDRDRSATYDFLLVFHSNYGPISYGFRDKGQYCKILPLRVFKAMVEGVSLESFNGCRTQKTIIMPLPYGIMPLPYGWNIVIVKIFWKSWRWRYFNSFRHNTALDGQLDRRTDRQTDWQKRHNNIALCVHCMLTLDNKTNTKLKAIGDCKPPPWQLISPNTYNLLSFTGRNSVN